METDPGTGHELQQRASPATDGHPKLFDTDEVGSGVCIGGGESLSQS